LIYYPKILSDGGDTRAKKEVKDDQLAQPEKALENNSATTTLQRIAQPAKLLVKCKASNQRSQNSDRMGFSLARKMRIIVFMRQDLQSKRYKIAFRIDI